MSTFEHFKQKYNATLLELQENQMAIIFKSNLLASLYI